MFAAVLAALLAQEPSAAVALMIEPRRETLQYRFENPSSFNTLELVPHRFEQTYATSNWWMGVRATYRLFGRAASTSAAITPQVTGQANDFDTFFQPDGNIVVSGTTGNASLRAWQVSQRLIVGGGDMLSYGIQYSYRRDSARYHDGTRITTMTAPPSEVREVVTTREFVASHVHELGWFARWRPMLGRRLSMSASLSPAVLGRLAVELPDKYPGRRLRFNASAAAMGGDLAYTRRVGALDVGGAVRVSRIFRLREAAQLKMASVSLVIHAGTR